MSDNPEKPWLLGRAHNPAREGLPALDEPTAKKMVGVRLYARDVDRLARLDVKPSDFIRQAVRERLDALGA